MAVTRQETRIDTRDLVEERDNLIEQRDASNDWDDESSERLAAIETLFEDISGYAGDSPEDGIFLIADSEFTDYAKELAEDIGAIDDDSRWPCYCIDWEWAANELKPDYTTVEFDGTTYWYR